MNFRPRQVRFFTQLPRPRNRMLVVSPDRYHR
jgi:hypothetical protein